MKVGTVFIVASSLLVGGLAVYLFNKPKKVGNANTPPMKVTGWTAGGNGSFSIGANSGTMNGATGAITQAAPQTYYIDNGGFDGQGWNFNILAGGAGGTLLNALYITGNGNFV